MPGLRPKYAISLSETQVRELTHLSVSYTAAYGEVQRARIVLCAHHHPAWTNSRIAREVGCCLDTVKKWRQRWRTQGTLAVRPRRGAPRELTPLVRAQITALACSNPSEHGKVWKRWSGEKLAAVAIEKQIVCAISPATIRRWLREDKIKPWRYHSWQKSTDPQFVEKAGPVLDLYENAQQLAARGEAVCCTDEKPSIQARQRVDATLSAVPGQPVRVADRYKRQGALQLFCALLVATGLTFADCYARKCFADFKQFLTKLFQSVHCQGLRVLHLIMDNGKTHAPKQLGGWIASLELSFEVRIYWLPTYASWLDQVEIIFSKVQRDVLVPNDFASTIALHRDLMKYFAEMNQHPKPIQWTYTKAKMVAKFGTPETVEELAA
ncbi:MAG: IS630 family transposase [Acidobacteria bacterium]|nr:IS630 family transposase [Acidobacteriota bacterium]